MIITRLVSGLGNQMFQYAAGLALAARRGAPLRLDLRFYAGQSLRRYELSRFAITARPITRVDRLRMTVSNPSPDPNWPRRVVRSLPVPRVRIVSDRVGEYDPSVIGLPDRSVLWGYWQDERYFADQADAVRRELRFAARPAPADAAVLDQIRRQPAVSVHVRRGDYLNPNEVVGPCGIDYYDRAIAWVAERVPNARLFVFSDDPAWCRANLPAAVPTTFVTHNIGVNDPEDLRLMSACDHFIIANSTFSWWGAWLAERPGTSVVAPARWFRSDQGNEAGVVPGRWVRL